MTQNSTSRFKMLWVLPPVILGIAILMVIKSGKLPPKPNVADRGMAGKCALHLCKKESADVPGTLQITDPVMLQRG